MELISNENTKYFAIFGDIHGRLSLMYTLAILWQRQSGIKLEAILQVGDMGAFPYLSNLDESTRKLAKKDRDELGFYDFHQNTPEAEFYLTTKNSPITYFIRGNHEDFNYLNTFTKSSPIDRWSKIWFLPDGHTVNLVQSDRIFKILGLGGLPPINEKRSRGKLARDKYRRSHQKINSDPRFFKQSVVENILKNSQKVDILITHAGPICAQLPEGSNLLMKVAKQLKPRVHIFGHHHRSVYIDSKEDNCLIVGLEHLNFDDRDKLIEDSWGILSISHAAISFNFMSPTLFPILANLNRSNYRSLLD
jgi:predicted phosphohydrolase